MNEHIDILLLLDYAQGKIQDDSERDLITDHLCDCEYCREILKSHYYLIRNHNILLEKFFPGPVLVVSDIKTPETAGQFDYQLSITCIIQSISDKILAIKKQGVSIGQEIKVEVLRALDEIKSLSNLEELLVPLKVENIALLGAEDTVKHKDQKLNYLSRKIGRAHV
jgi:hypothetical protein